MKKQFLFKFISYGSNFTCAHCTEVENVFGYIQSKNLIKGHVKPESI